jgi:hypothetical protein
MIIYINYIQMTIIFKIFDINIIKNDIKYFFIEKDIYDFFK